MREVKGLHDEILRPLLLTGDTLPPCFEEVDQMGVNRCGEFYFVQKGGDVCGIVCGFDNAHCSGECFKNSALYFTPNGEPLFFCRYYYTIFKGKKYVDEEKNDRLDERIPRRIHEEISGRASRMAADAADDLAAEERR